MASQATTDDPVAAAGPRLAIPSSGALAFVLVAGQFALILLAIERFSLENAALRSILWLAFGGFCIHHFLPLRARQPFFLALSVVGIAWVLGMDAGGWNPSAGLGRTALILAIGSALIGICHLPIPYLPRTLLLLAAGAGLAFLRTGNGFDFGSYAAVWPILGAMFMFRLIVYQYDLENMKQKPTWVSSLSYFFLLPNVCFPLFPVIDFKTFARSHFKRDAAELYDTGLRWMLRGVIHLVLWRLVYYQVFLDPSKVANGQDLVQFLVGNMLLYLRVSGQFHLVIGLLHMFGFGLPETNRFYFLASSFTDYWRRVNIYWKDFILKIFYNPVLFRLKHWGEIPSVVFATVVAFFMTWALHSYQWFWLRGDFPVTSNEMLFWGLLGFFVVLNSLRELTHGRQRTLGKRKPSTHEELTLALQTAAMFGTMTCLWSIWNSQSLNHVVELWKLADFDTLWISALVLAGIGASRVALERWEARTQQAKPKPKLKKKTEVLYYDWRRAATAVVLPGLILGLLSVRSLYPLLGGDAKLVLDSISSTKPNDADEEQMQAGYYEDLMDVRRFDSLLSAAYQSQPADWQILENTEAIRWIDDVRLKDLVESSEHTVNGHFIRINSHGMRDQEYPLEKPAGSHRIALLGSSLVMGWGVDQEELFEALLETRLKEQGRNVEILNFAINGYTPLSQVSIMRDRVLKFAPDAIYLVGHYEDAFFVKNRFAKALRKNVPLDSFLSEIAQKAKVDARTPPMWAAHRLDPFWPAMIERSLQEIGRMGREAGVELVWVYLPGVLETAEKARERKQLQMGFARAAGFRIVDLTGLYADRDREELAVASWDQHPNALAHRLIAEMLYEKLASTEEIGLFSKTAMKSAGMGEN